MKPPVLMNNLSFVSVYPFYESPRTMGFSQKSCLMLYCKEKKRSEGGPRVSKLAAIFQCWVKDPFNNSNPILSLYVISTDEMQKMYDIFSYYYFTKPHVDIWKA